MKKMTCLLLLTLMSIKGFSQNQEYIYKNEEFGVEVKFPSKPIESVTNYKGITTISVVSNLGFSAGLSYSLIIQKATVKVSMFETFKSMNYDLTLNSRYKINKNEVTEYERKVAGSCMQNKEINYKTTLVWLLVGAESSCVKDKDVYPFFNSLKIDGISIQNPSADNNKYIAYNIDYNKSTKTDTVKQIVYVNSNTKNNYQFQKHSDVDKDIPLTAQANTNRFALIIGNEDYSSQQLDLSSEINVDFARNDATAFKEYAINTLGIPEKNVIFLLDATTGQMNQGISKINLIIKNTQGRSEIFVYYAGHGLPDEQTKEAYIMPVDVSGKNANEGVALKLLYSKLTEFPSKRITVFIDACFSGGARNQGLLAARGVKVKPKEDLLNGNIVVFSASSGEQSSLSLKEKYHGMFTYYLLKKIQETKGDVNYSDLSKSINENVSLQSVLINDKEQSPQTNVSNLIQNEWGNYNLK